MIKKLLITTFLFLFTFVFPASATEHQNASGAEFATSYDVTFDIGEDGITTVTEKVTLKNLTSQYYANQFKLTIGATDITDIRASDPSGPMEVSSEQKDTSTTITVKFNQQVVGLNKTLPWTLQFKSKDFAERQGGVWEVRAPKISSTTNLENYNLAIAVPLSFGEPTLISPIPKTQTQNFGKMFLTFDMEQLKNSGVSANFGNQQLFDFNLAYNLENTGLVPILTNIALPPDTAYQDVIFQRIDPKPINVTVDDDGNYLGWYRLKRNEKLRIEVVGSAKLYTSSKVKNPKLESELYKRYTRSDDFWEKDNPAIKRRVGEIIGTAQISNAEKVRLIYQYVVSTLKYDPSRLSDDIERLGAVTALNNPSSAVCMEFTDLFITLTRAAGIPARELDGFAYTSNPSLRPLSLDRDILHSWPEYWDETKGWVMVDPTWENTTGGVDYFNKLDLNHFVFVVKGSSSRYPIPAGSYKYRNADSRDVQVNLSDIDFLGKPQLEVTVENPTPIWSGFPNKLKVRVSNLGNALQPSTSLVVSADKLGVLGVKAQDLGPIPAFGSAEFEYDIRTKTLFDNFEDEIKVLVGSQQFSKTISVRPFVIFQSFLIAIAGVILLMSFLYFSILGLYIYRKRILPLGKKK